MVASIERYRALAKHSQDRLFVAGARQNGCHGSHFGVVSPGLLCFFFDRSGCWFCFFCVSAYGECVWMCIDWCELFCFGVEENIGLVVRWLDF